MRPWALGALLGALTLGWLSLAQAQGASAFQLSWQHTQDQESLATSFALESCIQSGTACAFLPLSGATNLPYTQTTFTVTGITSNVTYCFRGFAVNQFGRSPASTQICGKLGAPPKNPVTGLQLNIITAP